MTNFKVGDKVRHKNNHAEGVIIDILNTLFVEVESDGDTYYWHQANIELIDEDGFDSWDMDFGYWDRQYSFEFGGSNEEDIKCICDSWTLFHFGCKCGAFQKEQDEKQRGSGRGDLDRKSKV